jgi:hypothetical protein
MVINVPHCSHGDIRPPKATWYSTDEGWWKLILIGSAFLWDVNRNIGIDEQRIILDPEHSCRQNVEVQI